jgi:hypothetical protein
MILAQGFSAQPLSVVSYLYTVFSYVLRMFYIFKLSFAKQHP